MQRTFSLRGKASARFAISEAGYLFRTADRVLTMSEARPLHKRWRPILPRLMVCGFDGCSVAARIADPAVERFFCCKAHADAVLGAASYKFINAEAHSGWASEPLTRGPFAGLAKI